MIYVLRNSWALLLGMLLLMLGNGVQGTLLGIRGALEGFTPNQMSWIMSGYFIGFLGGSRFAPEMIRRVGHVRVFAALGSFISAVLIMYAAVPDPWAWFFMRVVIGFCFSGVYVVAESWLNDAATNETRGQTMSVYLIVQMIGIVLAQGVMNVADAGDFTLFIIISVLVSISFSPILLSVSPVPAFNTAQPMTLKQLFKASPLGCVGNFFLGSVFSALFGMSAVYGTQSGMSVANISIFVATIYIGGMVLQYPIGWLSDRMDRRILIIGITAFGGAVMFVGMMFNSVLWVLLAMAFIVGGVSNPLYSLLIAYTNDYLEPDDMAAASGGLVFINGMGAIAGPFAVGWMMTTFGPNAFFAYLGVLLLVIASYALYRMTQRAAPAIDETTSYEPISPSSTPVAMEVVQEIAIERALEEESDDEPSK